MRDSGLPWFSLSADSSAAGQACGGDRGSENQCEAGICVSPYAYSPPTTADSVSLCGMRRNGDNVICIEDFEPPGGF